MATTIKELSYEDFPIKLFFKLLKRKDAVAYRILGEKKWKKFKENWENNHSTIESESLLERERNVSLSFMKSQKAALVLKWLAVTNVDPKPIIEDLGYKWHDNPNEMVNYLKRIMNKSLNKYEHESALLEKQRPKIEDIQETESSIDEAIASLDMMGFTIDNPNTLTIGRYQAMSKVAEKRMNQKAKSA